MMPVCLLCGGQSFELVNKIKTRDIEKIYWRLYSIDISECFLDHKLIEYYQCDKCNLLFYYPAVLGNKSLYDHMQQFDWYYSKYKYEFELARQLIKPDDLVLEVGCGAGWFLNLLDAKNCIGLELNPQASFAAARGENSIYIQTIEEHEINARQKYDVVCSFQVLEHVENPESFIRSCINCLKPDGLLMISVPSENSYLSIVEDGILNMPPHHLTRWTDKTLIWLANYFNLEIISLNHEPLSDDHVHGYATEIIRALIKSVFHLKSKVISTAVSHRFLTLICQILGRCHVKLLSNPSLRPVGDSVTLIAKKVAHL